jgi:hypothetical protein
MFGAKVTTQKIKTVGSEGKGYKDGNGPPADASLAKDDPVDDRASENDGCSWNNWEHGPNQAQGEQENYKKPAKHFHPA